ncbi:MAG: riboflavin synthase [Cytophagales bacterium]|nr:riboflavin synthase [Cytophagales bacterium]MDW8383525.1 riboflavin synthase [Flammeovirgaceae bacterium]
MFTGIIEAIGTIKSLQYDRTNLIIEVESSLSSELRVDQSVAHDGCCLTVTQVNHRTHVVTAIAETLQKTNLNTWKIGTLVNLERCMPANGRFDGHIVQGHVDQTAECIEVQDQNGSWIYTFVYSPEYGNMTVEKGSICVNGVSLTVVNSKEDQFSVAIIPYTYYHTNFRHIHKGDIVNIEFDIVGKYLQKIFKKYYQC